MRALNAIDTFDASRPMWPWLKTIALNLAIDHVRRTDREVLCDEIFMSSSDESERCDQSMMLEQAMDALPGRHRAALSLRYLNDWRPTEAAQFLGMSRPAFDQLLMRARRRLGVEYERMQSSLQGILLLTQGRIRSLLEVRTAPVWRKLQNSGLPPSAMASVSHVITAAAVVITTIATPHAPVDAPDGGGSIVAPVQVARSDDRKAPADADPKAPSDRTDSGKTPATGGGTQGTTWSKPNDAPLNGGAKKITDPHSGVKDPEDVQITSVAFGKDDGSVVYATGKKHCQLPCSPVLFRSADGGETWTRQAARGLGGEQIAVPPGRPHTVFAMSARGLQVSRNDGDDFGPAIATGPPMTSGSMAISPRWNSGDPTVLVGAQTLLQYRDSTGTADPYAASLAGPFEPAYSTLTNTEVFFLGALRPNGVTGPRAAVYTCTATGCNFTGLPDRDQLPKVRPSKIDANLVYAFTQQDLFASHSRAAHFQRIPLPWSEPRMFDLEALPQDDSLIAALTSIEESDEDGLYVSRDGGHSWTQSDSTLFDSGTTDITATGSRVVVALMDKGLACSNDGGRTFSRRCSS